MCKFATVLQVKSPAVKNICFLVGFNSAVAQPLRRTFSLTKGNGRVGQDIYKRRLLRFGFDNLKS